MTVQALRYDPNSWEANSITPGRQEDEEESWNKLEDT